MKSPEIDRVHSIETMTDFDRKAHWDNIYGEKSTSEVSWYQADPRISVDMIDSCGINPCDPIIDVGAGSSLLVDRLIQKGYKRLTVLDISPVALANSQQRLGALADKVDWIEADAIGFRSKSRFALWHDRAVFHFLTDENDRKKYIATIASALNPSGYLIIATFAIGGPEKCSGLPTVQYDATKITAELGARFALIEERSEEHITPAGLMQKFSYFLFQMCV